MSVTPILEAKEVCFHYQAGKPVLKNLNLSIPAGSRVALVGLPDDTGVELNNGRTGASKGPAAFRAALARYGQHVDAERGFQRRVFVQAVEALQE